jgi:hypothetical protein
MKRYWLTAEFVDTDFNLGYSGERFWFQKNAVLRWEYLEKQRHNLREKKWRWVVKDTKTNSVIRPLGETQAAN